MVLINKLKEKGRIGLIVGSLGLAGLISLEGCEMTPEQAKGAKVLGVLAQMSPYTNPAQRLAGAGMSAAADYDHDMHTAREERNEVNVNVSGQEDRQQRTGADFYTPTPDSFTCDGFKDINGDGVIGKGELINVRSYFECRNYHEIVTITMGSTWHNAKGDSILTKIKWKDGGVSVKEEVMGRENGLQLEYLQFQKTHGDGIWEYVVEFYKNGKLDASKTLSFFVDFGEKIVEEKKPEEVEQTKK